MHSKKQFVNLIVSPLFTQQKAQSRFHYLLPMRIWKLEKDFFQELTTKKQVLKFDLSLTKKVSSFV